LADTKILSKEDQV